MSIIRVNQDCCGCRACKTVCPFDAISVENDRYGFERMVVDQNRCRECGRCVSVCPAIHTEHSSERYSCGAAYALDETVKYQGSSGGLFGVFARHWILEGGIVYGAAFDHSLHLRTTAATTPEELVPLYKSKYLLCDTDDKFFEIQERLDAGMAVLYCSSPCQIAALRLFLKKEYANLFTVDFVCHGVGSQSLFERSIAYSEKRLSAKIKSVVFRSKGKKVSSHYYSYECENEKRSYSRKGLYLSFPYYNAYCKQLVCRESCYDCRYATEARVSDITIGDFHNIEAYDASIDRFAGVSMFVCNTVKGELYFERVREALYVQPFAWEILRSNNRFGSDGARPKEQMRFMESVAMDPFEVTVKRYLHPLRDWKRLIYYKSPAFLRRIARMIRGKIS